MGWLGRKSKKERDREAYVASYEGQRDYWFGFAMRQGAEWNKESHAFQELDWLENYYRRLNTYVKNQKHPREIDLAILADSDWRTLIVLKIAEAAKAARSDPAPNADI